MKQKEEKIHRILDMYTRLQQDGIIYKKEEADRFRVTEKSIQRDIEDIRAFLGRRMINEEVYNDVIYDYDKHGYHLENDERKWLENEEILAVMKILLESRALMKSEMEDILDKLLESCVRPKDRKIVNELVANERLYYKELEHHKPEYDSQNSDKLIPKKPFKDKMWRIAIAIREQRCIEILYHKAGSDRPVKRKLDPLAIMFSEFYFYLAANIKEIDREKEFQITNDTNPTIYRIDRIETLKVLDEHYMVAEKDRFQLGEYRSRIQFMYGGKLQRIEFWYKGWSLEAVLDKLPTAEIAEIDKENHRYRIRALTFGKGIDMWLKSQEDFIEGVRVF